MKTCPTSLDSHKANYGIPVFDHNRASPITVVTIVNVVSVVTVAVRPN